MNNERFNEAISGLWLKTKSAFKRAKESVTSCELTSLAYRPVRFNEVETLIESYIITRDKRPEPTQLDRLATLCLYEEITDPHPDKMSRDEFPIMSRTQEEERHDDEVKETWAESVGVDGRDHRAQTREYRRKLRNFT